MTTATLLFVAVACVAAAFGLPKGFYQQPVNFKAGGANAQVNPFYQPPTARRGRYLDAGPEAVASYDAPARSTDNTVPGSVGPQRKPYNARYPLTAPVLKFRIGVVSDLDKDTKETKDGQDEFHAFLNEGNLLVQQNTDDPKKSNITVEWDEKKIHDIRSKLNWGGRGLELSTLNVFNGNLYACDDKTGIVFELPLNETDNDIVPVPWVILADGAGNGSISGFKCEWATIKDGDLWVGGDGTLPNQKFVKKITPEGGITHLDWTSNFEKMTAAVDIKEPGYVNHEAAAWSDIHQKWLFMPRRVSKEAYTDDAADGVLGSNMILLVDEDFQDIQVSKVGDLIPTHGFASMKFIPNTGDQLVVALKSVESDGVLETYIMAFDLSGNILLAETKFADKKYDGIEFL